VIDTDALKVYLAAKNTERLEMAICTRNFWYAGKGKKSGFATLIYRRTELDGFKMIRVEYNDIRTGDLLPIYYIINRSGFWMISNTTKEMVRLSDDTVDIVDFTLKNFESIPVNDTDELRIAGSSTDFILIERTLSPDQRQTLEKLNRASIEKLKGAMAGSAFTLLGVTTKEDRVPLSALYRIGVPDRHIYETKYYNKSRKEVKALSYEEAHGSFEKLDIIEDSLFVIPKNYKIYFPGDYEETKKTLRKFRNKTYK
jgi:hypothetical protein